MRTATIEVYSDASNAAVMRHPGRRFPGVLVQGDTLHTLWARADDAFRAARGVLNEDALSDLEDLRDHLRGLVEHYTSVLTEHGLTLPFHDGDATLRAPT